MRVWLMAGFFLLLSCGERRLVYSFTCLSGSHAMILHSRHRHHSAPMIALHQANQSSGNQQNDDEPPENDVNTENDALQNKQRDNPEPSLSSMEDQMNAFLDTEFFNPEDIPDGSPLKWFADLVQSDYQTAEALYTSVFIAGMVLLTQELVRMQMYGERYVPFTKLGDGSLF